MTCIECILSVNLASPKNALGCYDQWLRKTEHKEIAAVSSGPRCIPLLLQDVAKLPHIPPPKVQQPLIAITERQQQTSVSFRA